MYDRMENGVIICVCVCGVVGGYGFELGAGGREKVSGCLIVSETILVPLRCKLCEPLFQ